MTIEQYDRDQNRPLLRFWVGRAGQLEAEVRDLREINRELREIASLMHGSLLRSLGGTGYPSPDEAAITARYLNLLDRLENRRRDG